MEIIGDSLDGLLVQLYDRLLESTDRNAGSRGGTVEMLGVTLRLTKPRARLSRSEDRGKPFSALGELLWYLSGSDKLEFIEAYVKRYRDDAVNGVIHGAYGPRLLEMRGTINQFDNIVALLTERPGSRRAVIQLFNAEDIAQHYPEIPCTTTLQFFIRNAQLNMSVTMRSNDAYFGLPHDVFCFTMIQEMIARRLGVELGEYIHYVGSMHIYDERLEAAKQYAEEGWQRTVEMPIMPEGNAFDMVPVLLKVDDHLRHGDPVTASEIMDQSYWADIVRLLQVYWLTGRKEELEAVADEFDNAHYRLYVEPRHCMAMKKYYSRELSAAEVVR